MDRAAVFSRTVSALDPPTGEIAIEATEAERAELAAVYEVVAVKALAATATVTPTSRGGVTVSGRVIADIVQTCVVSLVPVEQHIDEDFSVRFVREAPPAPKPGEEIVFDPSMPDPPEVLGSSSVDVGAVAEEHFALAIDPYPRAPGAELPTEYAAGDGHPAASPFAALAKLARRPDDKS